MKTMKTVNLTRKSTTTLVAERLAAADAEKAARAEERRAARDAAKAVAAAAVTRENKILSRRAAHPQAGIPSALGVRADSFIHLTVVEVFS